MSIDSVDFFFFVLFFFSFFKVLFLFVLFSFFSLPFFHFLFFSSTWKGRQLAPSSSSILGESWWGPLHHLRNFCNNLGKHLIKMRKMHFNYYWYHIAMSNPLFGVGILSIPSYLLAWKNGLKMI